MAHVCFKSSTTGSKYFPDAFVFPSSVINLEIDIILELKKKKSIGFFIHLLLRNNFFFQFFFVEN